MASCSHDEKWVRFDNYEQLSSCIQQLGPFPDDWTIYVEDSVIREPVGNGASLANRDSREQSC